MSRAWPPHGGIGTGLRMAAGLAVLLQKLAVNLLTPEELTVPPGGRELMLAPLGTETHYKNFYFIEV